MVLNIMFRKNKTLESVISINKEYKSYIFWALFFTTSILCFVLSFTVIYGLYSNVASLIDKDYNIPFLAIASTVLLIISIICFKKAYDTHKKMTAIATLLITGFMLIFTWMVILYEGPITGSVYITLTVLVIAGIFLKIYTEKYHCDILETFIKMLPGMATIIIITMFSSSQIASIRPIIFHSGYSCPKILLSNQTIETHIKLGNYGKIPSKITVKFDGKNILVTSPYIEKYPNLRPTGSYSIALVPMEYNGYNQTDFKFLIKIRNSSEETAKLKISFINNGPFDSPAGEEYYSLLSMILEKISFSRYHLITLDCEYIKSSNKTNIYVLTK